MHYIALLRGINVGGNNTISMSELKLSLEKAGLENVRTYINSGNVLFTVNKSTESKLAQVIEKTIDESFGLTIRTVVITESRLRNIMNKMPKGWGENKEFKYNLIFLIPPYHINEVVEGIGVLKPDIEDIVVGDGVLYQSISWTMFGRATSGKIASRPVYKQMTIRTIGTGRKLLSLLEAK